jgi:ubiquinone/menaquinone biosynthesis C-methylase UbiE
MEFDEYAKMYELEDSHWWFRGKRKIAERIIARYVTLAHGNRILDVGCGTGGMLTLLRQYGVAVGLDISSFGLHFAVQRGPQPLLQGSALNLPFADDSFDLVTGFDVLYHEQVDDDRVALREFYRVCRPGGSLILTDSALNILRGQHDQAYHAQRRYTRREMRVKVTEAGFRPLKVTYANTFLFPMVLFVRMWKRRFNGVASHRSDLYPMPALLNQALYSIYSFEASLLKFLDLPVGSSVVCVARKERVAETSAAHPELRIETAA